MYPEGATNMSRQSDQKTSKQVRIDSGMHKLAKIRAAEEGMTLKALLEWCLADYLGPDKDEKK